MSAAAGEGSQRDGWRAETAREIRLVALNEIDAVWPLIAEGMKAACRRSGDDLTPWFLLQSVRRGDALLFVAIAGGALKAALVCRPETWGERRVLRILALAGADVEHWLPALSAHREWTDALGVQSVVFEGRPGWRRVVKNACVLRTTYEVKIDDWFERNE
jgi:hypothetical protein